MTLFTHQKVLTSLTQLLPLKIPVGKIGDSYSRFKLLAPGIVRARSPEELVHAMSSPDIIGVVYRPFSLQLRLASHSLQRFFIERKQGDLYYPSGFPRRRIALATNFPIKQSPSSLDDPYKSVHTYLTEIGFAEINAKGTHLIAAHTQRIQSLLNRITEECMPVKSKTSQLQINLGCTAPVPHFHTDITAVSVFVGKGTIVIREECARKLEFTMRNNPADGWGQFHFHNERSFKESEIFRSPRYSTIFLKGLRRFDSLDVSVDNIGAVHMSSPGDYRFVTVQGVNILTKEFE